MGYQTSHMDTHTEVGSSKEIEWGIEGTYEDDEMVWERCVVLGIAKEKQ